MTRTAIDAIVHDHPDVPPSACGPAREGIGDASEKRMIPVSEGFRQVAPGERSLTISPMRRIGDV